MFKVLPTAGRAAAGPASAWGQAEFGAEGRPQGMGVGKTRLQGDVLKAPCPAREEFLRPGEAGALQPIPRLPPVRSRTWRVRLRRLMPARRASGPGEGARTDRPDRFQDFAHPMVRRRSQRRSRGQLRLRAGALGSDDEVAGDPIGLPGSDSRARSAGRNRGRRRGLRRSAPALIDEQGAGIDGDPGEAGGEGLGAGPVGRRPAPVQKAGIREAEGSEAQADHHRPPLMGPPQGGDDLRRHGLVGVPPAGKDHHVGLPRGSRGEGTSILKIPAANRGAAAQTSTRCPAVRKGSPNTASGVESMKGLIPS